MGKTLSEDLRGRVIVAVEGGARRMRATVRFATAATTVVRWLRMWREDGAHPVIVMGATRRSTSLRSRRPEGERRFVPTPIGRPSQQQGMSYKRTAHASERQVGRRRPPAGLVRDAAGPGSRAGGVRRGDRRFEQLGPATRPRRAMPDARPHSHWALTRYTDAPRLHGMIVRLRADSATNGGAVLVCVEHALAAEAVAR